MSELVELIVLTGVLGIIGILAVYAYNGIMKVLGAFQGLLPFREIFDELKGKFEDLFYHAQDLQKAFAAIGQVGEDVMQAFSGIFDIFKVIKTILGPICQILGKGNKVVSGTTDAIGKGFNAIGSVF